MFLLAPIQNQYPMLFLSECFPHRSLISSSQHSAKSAHDMKIRLVRLASKLRGIPDRSASREAATPKEGRRRVRLTLDPQTQHALDGLSLTPSNAVNTVNTRRRRSWTATTGSTCCWAAPSPTPWCCLTRRALIPLR